MNKKGFTLIELLGVLILLALISIILIPNIGRTLKQGREKSDKQTEESVVLAARSWATDNKTSLPQNTNGVYTVKLAALQSGGYIDNNLKNPSTGEALTGVCVDIKNIGTTEAGKKKYTYTYRKGC